MAVRSKEKAVKPMQQQNMHTLVMCVRLHMYNMCQPGGMPPGEISEALQMASKLVRSTGKFNVSLESVVAIFGLAGLATLLPVVF